MNKQIPLPALSAGSAAAQAPLYHGGANSSISPGRDWETPLANAVRAALEDGMTEEAIATALLSNEFPQELGRKPRGKGKVWTLEFVGKVAQAAPQMQVPLAQAQEQDGPSASPSAPLREATASLRSPGGERVTERESEENAEHAEAESQPVRDAQGRNEMSSEAALGGSMQDAQEAARDEAPEADEHERQSGQGGSAWQKAAPDEPGPKKGWQTNAIPASSLISDKSASSSTVKAFVRLVNEEYAVVDLNGKTQILHEEKNDQAEIVKVHFIKQTDLQQNALHVVPHGKQISCYGTKLLKSEAWLASDKARRYKRLVFEPPYKGASKPNPENYNLWQGFAIDPGEGDCSRMLDHIKTNIANGDDTINKYVLDWCADLVQNPGRKAGVALVMRGKQGTGKGTLAKELGKFFGRNYFPATQQKHLTSAFNAHLKEIVLLFADEVFCTGDKAAAGVLRTLVTEPTITIEIKMGETFDIPNYIHLIMASNESWVVPAGENERRLCVLDVGDSKMQDKAYFDALYKQQENGGRGAFLDLLLARDISDVNIADFPKTAALREQQEESMSPFHAWWYEILQKGCVRPQDGRWYTLVPNADLEASYREYAKTPGKADGKLQKEFNKGLTKLYPSSVPSQRRTGFEAFLMPGEETGGKRVSCRQLPLLEEARALFNETCGMKTAWTPVEDDADDEESFLHESDGKEGDATWTH